MKCKLIALALTFASGSHCFGQSALQQVINTSGGSYQQGHFSIDWSIGELAAVNTMQSADMLYNLTNGFLQTITDPPNVVIANTELKQEEVRILPNPTRDILEVDLKTNQTGSVTMQLYDILGQPLVKRSFYMYGYAQLQKINMSAFRPGNYILKITLQLYQGSELRSGSFKIVKL
ncbi:T9SS type A sorting domain-containing protein [Ferruginibacter paludis]|uniref:T9SS type A sorting domain-containing protein n=1 Tax=Ferruginibacter paludis TaxID=1310417 RepID=UPI0025B571DA|nr:T9SS type A sorting domain-containing protein [Ferruginibacter paludis]MDN3655744.1 T9SS type A sorting domain-containing protein [Ferruginibacter paludis]